MVVNDRKGFSLIELMIVIAIIGILVAVALPEFASMTEDAKKTKAKQDCDTIVQAIQKYNSLEGSMVTDLMDLKGKYLTNIDTLKDPWGNAYELDPYGGYVFSRGPDGQMKKEASGAINWKDKRNKDNLRISYIGALSIVDAKLEVDPLGESQPELRRDILHLYFNKTVKVVQDININADSVSGDPETEVPPSKAVIAGKTADPACADGKVFRWCMGSRNKYVSGDTVLLMADATDGLPDRDTVSAGSGTCDEDCVYGGDVVSDLSNPDFDFWEGQVPDALADGSTTTGAIFDTPDHREVIIVLPAGSSGSIVPGSHYVNLTGNRKS
jgi:prepilin-type N-terminal cleavage/methylation domain-containing protein